MIGFDLIPSFWDDGEIREGGRVTYTCLKPEGRSEGERRKYAAPKALLSTKKIMAGGSLSRRLKVPDSCQGVPFFPQLD